jgi:methionyl-tRNA synthetase
MNHISYETFQSLDMRVGTIRFVEPVEGTDKLLRCLVDFGPEIATMTYTDEAGVEYPVRQIVSGIRLHVPEFQTLIDKQVLYIVNLEPRMIKDIESQGMLMALGDENHPLVFLTPDQSITPGSKVR